MWGALLVVVMAEAVGTTAVEGVFQDTTSALVLGADRGDCPEGEKKAAFVGKDGIVAGCWFERDGTVWIVWKDGDRSAVPKALFKKPAEA